MYHGVPVYYNLGQLCKVWRLHDSHNICMYLHEGDGADG